MMDNILLSIVISIINLCICLDPLELLAEEASKPPCRRFFQTGEKIVGATRLMNIHDTCIYIIYVLVYINFIYMIM